MTIQPLSIPIYEITCPACKKSFLEALAKVITENFTHCPACHERINVDLYYSRARVIEFMQKVGYSGNFISVNDKL